MILAITAASVATASLVANLVQALWLGRVTHKINKLEQTLERVR